MSVLIKPLITEKASALNENGKYGFVVQKTANKVEIKKEVEQLYGVTVESVNTMIYQVIKGRTSAFKKAIITVADGEVIDFYSGV